MRNVTLLSMFTGPLVGLNSVLVIVNAACVIVTLAEPAPMVPPPALAVAAFVAAAVAVAVKETMMLVLSPGLSGPTLVQLNVPAPTLSGARLADWKLRLVFGKLSVSDTFVRTVL